jgi:hypothetical protein
MATWRSYDEKESVRLAGIPDSRAFEELMRWVEALLGPEDAAGKRFSPRIRDLHALAYRDYYHPLMGGRTSIKVVMPAIWKIDPDLRGHPWFEKYNKTLPDGRSLDPYETLPPLPLGDDGQEDVVQEGTGAIRMYQDVIFRQNVDPAEHESRRQLLLQYCELDTAAMVMIWKHWLG